MEKEQNRNFIQKTENLVKPQDITAISFLGDFNKLLPKKTQHKIMEKGSKKIPYMGFIVDPYCFFLSYRIKDVPAAQAMLPEGYEIAETSVFKNGKKYPMVVTSAFTARTSAFIGTRLEFYIIARNKETGLLSWIISDYETNTNSHDPKNGFCGYSSDPTVFATTPYGELLINFQNNEKNSSFKMNVDLTGGETEELSAELWVEGNMSIDYGGKLKDDSSNNFSLIFDPFLMKEAQNIPISDITISENSYLGSIIDSKAPVDAAVFPYSQHFIIKQDLRREELNNEGDLEKLSSEFIERSGYKTMSGDDIKKPLFRSMLISSIINIGIIVFLLLKLLL
ncbi:MAG: hypothetical protein PQJ61_01740 [Spirochaetales bacterium]|uniref:Uncharacterized protein n=1 Tax=Candidatus Thalassospirochaeta sargassi TaxID=3119039 RepID=A0AAJ1MIF8_9SPIO|nr:hypothetical protein [Spirochaetales bacterium]